MKIILLSLLVFFYTVPLFAQGKTKPVVLKKTTATVQINNKTIPVKGLLINSFKRRSDLSSLFYLYDFYYFKDAANKIAIFTEVYHEITDGKSETKSITTFSIPLIRLNKKDSYVLDMEDEYTEGGKYYRLSLLNNGTNQAYFKQVVKQAGESSDTVSMVSFVTIPFSNKTLAEKNLKEITK